MYITHKPYWFTPENIKKIENLKSATYVGAWCLRTTYEGWGETPVDIFYQENPNTALGHSNYFGMFYRNNELYVTDGKSAFDTNIVGILAEDGEVIVSRYRHDYQARKGVMIDGGRDYIRHSGGTLVSVKLNGSTFSFEVCT